MNSSNVFQLIKSLTRNEKRFFKIYSERHVIGKKNKYVTLFEILDKLKEEHDEKILQKLRKQGQGKFIASEKNYLHNHLLSVLNIFHTNSTIDNKLGNMLQSAELLLGKSLYGNSRSLLIKAKKLAYEYDKFEYILKILKNEREITDRITTSVLNQRNALDQLYKEEVLVVNMIRNQIDLKYLSDILFIQAKKSGIARTETSLKQCREIFSNLLLQHEKSARSYDAQRYYLNAHIYYYYILNDTEKSHLYRRKLIELIESNQSRINENPKIYISGLNNILLSCIQLAKHKDFFKYLDKIRGVPGLLPKSSRTHFITIRIFESSFINETDYYLRTKEFEKGVKIAMHVEKLIPVYRSKMEKSSEITLYLNIMCLYFNAGRYHQALKWNNILLNSKWGDVREDLVSFSKITNLLIHYELGNFIELPYYLKSTYRYLVFRNRLLKYEKVILKYIKKILKADRGDIKEILVPMRNELEILKNDPREAIMFHDIDVANWIEKKVQTNFNRKFIS